MTMLVICVLVCCVTEYYAVRPFYGANRHEHLSRLRHAAKVIQQRHRQCKLRPPAPPQRGYRTQARNTVEFNMNKLPTIIPTARLGSRFRRSGTLFTFVSTCSCKSAGRSIFLVTVTGGAASRLLCRAVPAPRCGTEPIMGDLLRGDPTAWVCGQHFGGCLGGCRE
ncbi:hypothetical protein QBC34DRAFT_24731 [Podospora aff. communis PSN243]|uniref:Secreted protein n=1 Tax=Podospora aff. communis PSN243 TaxID=3040156 RepID=A0AAV9FZV2_9PEZI|nr:hypothetical protein QBC34DRAFT_24731 [Podospora aff. communis PSN243]